MTDSATRCEDRESPRTLPAAAIRARGVRTPRGSWGWRHERPRAFRSGLLGLGVALGGAIFLVASIQALGAPLREVLSTPQLRPVRSSTGQFLVGRPRVPGAASERSRAVTNQDLVELAPETVAVTCERVKRALLNELGMSDAWYGRIHVLINPLMTNGQPALIGAKPYLDGWQYQVELPLWSEPIKLVRGIVHVLLLEIANRSAGVRSGEIPLWLSEGMTQCLVHSSLADLVIARPQQTVNQVRVRWQSRPPARRDPMKEVRERLQTHAAFSFARLGEIDTSQMSDESWRTFQASAHLFVDQLLQLPAAREQLLVMLLQLPWHLNWQVAFLNGFQRLFPRMLDVEKWWSVVLIHFSGIDSANAWSLDIALGKLQEALQPPVLISTNPKDLPQRANVSVQTILNRFDYLRQRLLLQEVLRQLATLRVRMPPALVPLLDGYRQTVGDYLARRDRAGLGRSLPGLPPLNSDRLIREIVDKLDTLDRQRGAVATGSSLQIGAAPAQP